MKGRFFIARHGETVFNAVGRMQGDVPHTPLTRAGFAQADSMGTLLRARLGPRPPLDLWASPAGRAAQTLAVIAEHLELDWNAARADRRLREIDIGNWSGRYHCEFDEPLIDTASGLFKNPPPGGEWYDAVAARLRAWLADTADESADRLIVMHGMSSRVLRGLLTDAPADPGCGVPVAPLLRQGAVAEIANGAETLLHEN